MTNIVILKEYSPMRLAKVAYRGDEKTHVLMNEFNGGVLSKKVRLKYSLVSNDKLTPIRELDDTINELTDIKNVKVTELKNKIKSTDLKDYSDELDKSYKRIKNQIIRTAEHMIEGVEFEDEKFENKLKAICDLKKQLFSIPCEEAREARKYNGTIKFNTRKLEREFDEQMMLMDLEKFRNLLEDTN